MTCFCPHCGFDLESAKDIQIGDFRMVGENGPLQFKGKRIRLTVAEKAFCWSLIRAYPRPVKRDALLNRMGSDSHSNVLHVIAHRVRARFSDANAPVPIKTIPSVGYVWESAA